MPWEAAILSTASIDSSDKASLKEIKKVAGANGKVCVTQPVWGVKEASGKLYFLSDETGYLNLWSIDTEKTDAKAEMSMKPLEKDLADPMWALGTIDIAVLDGATALVAPISGGETLSHFDLNTGKIKPLQGGEVYRAILQLKRLSDTQAVFIGQKSSAPPTLVIVTLGSAAGHADFTEVKTTAPEFAKKPVDPEYASVPETYTLSVPWSENAKRPEGMDTDQKEVDLHVIVFPPKNPNFKGPEGSKPPCLVGVHGGP